MPAPQLRPVEHEPPHAGWPLLMHGVDPAGTQPHVVLNVLSSMSRVEHTSPAGHAPPHVAPMATPPESAHGVETAGRQVQPDAGSGVTVAQQLEPAGHEPPHPGQMPPPQGGPDGSVVVVVVVDTGGFNATNTAAT